MVFGQVETDLDGDDHDEYGSDTADMRQMILDGDEHLSDEDAGGIPASMLSMALPGESFNDYQERPSEDNGGVEEIGRVESDEVDIDQFKEDCWAKIAAAQQGDGVSGLADMLEDDELGGDDENRIRVVVRTRPMNERETRLGTQQCIEHMEDGKNLIVRKHRYQEEPYDLTFAFDNAFGMDTHQDQVGG
jgi:hypothetical protein